MKYFLLLTYLTRNLLWVLILLTLFIVVILSILQTNKATKVSNYIFIILTILQSNLFQISLILLLYPTVISQTPKHVWDMFNFNTTSNPHRYLVLFMSKTPSVVWYFIMDLIPPKVRGYFALFESKSAVIFICIHCLIISFKLRKFTQILHGVFSSPNLNSYIVFH